MSRAMQLRPQSNGRRGVGRRSRKRLALAASYLVCTVFAIVLGFPFYLLVTNAFKTEAEIRAIPPILVPTDWSLDNFQQAWNTFNFGRYFWNSTWTSLLRAGIPALTSVLCGYVLAKIRFRGRNVIFIGLLATMMLPGSITLIPSYILMARLHWIGTYLPLIVPGAFSAFGIFLMRQLMTSLPDETLDAGRIDGASEWALFSRLALPSMYPGLAALFILGFIGAWDDFVWPLMVLNDPSMYTLPVGLASFTLEHYTLLGPLMAGSVVTILPVMLVFYFGQRRIVESGLFAGLRL